MTETALTDLAEAQGRHQDITVVQEVVGLTEALHLEAEATEVVHPQQEVVALRQEHQIIVVQVHEQTSRIEVLHQEVADIVLRAVEVHLREVADTEAQAVALEVLAEAIEVLAEAQGLQVQVDHPVEDDLQAEEVVVEDSNSKP